MVGVDVWVGGCVDVLPGVSLWWWNLLICNGGSIDNIYVYIYIMRSNSLFCCKNSEGCSHCLISKL